MSPIGRPRVPGSIRDHPGLARHWRWLVLPLCAGLALALGAIAALTPPGTRVDVNALRDRILASAGQPYSAYSESVGQVGLPDIAQLDSVISLLSGTTRTRAWYAGPDRWRVDALTPVGERDSYRLGDTEYVWDFGVGALTRIISPAAVRPPRPADLTPPELARRMLAAARTDQITPLPDARVAGIAVPGLRLVPADPDTTIGRLDVWADPGTGLALRVSVTARGSDRPLLVSEVKELDLGTPDPSTLTPAGGTANGLTTTRGPDLTAALRDLDARPAPPRLAGRDQLLRGGELPGIGWYGTGLTRFAVVPLSRGLTDSAFGGARDAGATRVPLGGRAEAMRLDTSLLTLAVVRAGRGRAYLLAGTVQPAVLDRAAAELAAPRSVR